MECDCIGWICHVEHCVDNHRQEGEADHHRQSLQPSVRALIWPHEHRDPGIMTLLFGLIKFMIKWRSSMAISLPVKNLLPQNVGSIINYLQ